MAGTGNKTQGGKVRMCKQDKSFSFYVVAGYTWVNAGATASTAVVLFSHNYLPPERQELVKKNANCKQLCLLLDTSISLNFL